MQTRGAIPLWFQMLTFWRPLYFFNLDWYKTNAL